LQLVAAYRAHHADRIVAERNNGGAMVKALCVQARIRLIVWCLPFGEPKRAAAATKTWLLAQIEKKRAPAAPTAKRRRTSDSSRPRSRRSRSPRRHPTSCGYQCREVDGRAPAVFLMYQAIDRNSR
jgi:hypothetical protein